MRYSTSCVALLALAGCASPPPQHVSAPASQVPETPGPVVTPAEARKLGYRIVEENGRTVYCRDQMESGSRVRKDTICLTARQLAVAQDASKRELEKMDRTIRPATCGPFEKTDGC